MPRLSKHRRRPPTAIPTSRTLHDVELIDELDELLRDIDEILEDQEVLLRFRQRGGQ